MIYGGWRSHYEAWTSYRRQRETLVREIDAIPCSANWMQGCEDCCTAKDVDKLTFLRSLLRGVALSEDYHEMMHRNRLAQTLQRRQAREQARRRVA